MIFLMTVLLLKCILRLFFISTNPSVRANRVWSLPIPTFLPGRTSVPRCLTKIEPVVVLAPGVTLTPRYLGFESLPFFVDPPAFFVAISYIIKCV